MEKQKKLEWKRVLSKKWLSAAFGAAFLSSSAMALVSGPMSHQRTDTPKMADATVGRYIYVGNVPRFAPEKLELTVSKMSLTLRVKGWVTQELQDNYGYFLLQRWKRIHDAFQSPRLSFIPLRNASQLALDTSDSGQKAWLKIASQYMKHELEDTESDIYAEQGYSGAADYTYTVLTAILRDYLKDNKAEIEDGLKLHERLQNPAERARSAAWSADLFKKHLSSNFTAAPSSKGDLGYLTFVYPIAATTNGPFSIPGEGVRPFGLDGSIEARWWSDKWKDEFGGLPFLLLDWNGVAFHGPITNKKGLDVWYLRRDYVSHGCHRMDVSDLLEFRSLLPTGLGNLDKQGRSIRAVELEWPDVTDVNADGVPEAVDVAYYSIPGNVSVARGQSVDAAAAPWMLPVAQQRYWSEHFSPYNGKLPSRNRIDAQNGVFYGIPKYEISGKSLKKVGYHDAVPIQVFEYRGNRAIQYLESGIRLSGHNDGNGMYPPQYFNSP